MLFPTKTCLSRFLKVCHLVILAWVSWEPLTAQEPAATPKVVTTAEGSDEGSARAQQTAWEEPIHTDVRPSSFQEITPGETSLEQLIELMGDPKETTGEADELILTYQLGPFPNVEMLVRGDQVDSIVVNLGQPVPAADVAEELGLGSFRPANIYGEKGETLGQVYPERGVAFSFSESTGGPKVTQLVLEPISAEFFVLRAGDDTNVNHSQSFADLNYALNLDDKNAQAWWLKSKLLIKIGHFDSAMDAADRAVKLSPNETKFRLTRAQLLVEKKDYDTAISEIDSVLKDTDSDFVRAQAKALLGDMQVLVRSNYEAAMESHLEAIELSVPYAMDVNDKVRREAKRFLTELHISVSNDITRGTFTSKTETAPKWLRTTRELADQLVEEENGDKIIQLVLYKGALRSYVGMRGTVDPTEVTIEAKQLAQNLLSETKDPLRKREIQWHLIECLYETARIEQMRGENEKVVGYANETTNLLNQVAATEDTSNRANSLKGRLYFTVGSMFAIKINDHEQAVRWYEKALPYLSRTTPPGAGPALGRNGQRFVSMGVSYWQVNVRDEAIALTEQGLEMMLSSHDAGNLEAVELAVPYGNLAAMLDEIGRSDEAKKFAAKAARLETGGTQQR